MTRMNIWKRALLGMPLGIAVTQIISICVSYALGGSAYYPCVPELIDAYGGNELAAAVVQLLVSMGYGALCGAASIIWDIERWSLVRRTALFFGILLAGMLTAGYTACWMPHSWSGMLRYILIFAGIFAVIWVTEYAVARKRMQELNAELAKSRGKINIK